MLHTRFNAQRMAARWAILFCCMTVLLFASIGYSPVGRNRQHSRHGFRLNGAVVPNAPVTLTDQSTAGKAHGCKQQCRQLSFPGIPIGTYNLQVAAPGFKTYVQTGIVLEVGSNIAVNAALDGRRRGREGRGAGRGPGTAN